MAGEGPGAAGPKHGRQDRPGGHRGAPRSPREMNKSKEAGPTQNCCAKVISKPGEKDLLLAFPLFHIYDP